MRKKMCVRKFVAKKASMFDEKKVQLFGEYLWAKQEQIGRPLEPVDVVRDAESNASPLHECFEWDDGMAAESWRLQQARQLLNHIEVVIERQGEDDSQVRAFHCVTVEYEDRPKEKHSGYVNVEEVIGNPDYYDQVVKKALTELNTWRKRYQMYQELKPVFLAIEKVEKKIA